MKTFKEFLNEDFDLMSDNKIITIKLFDSKISYRRNIDTIKIFSIRTPSSKRDNGIARRAMVEFLKETDKLKLTTILDSSPLDKKTKDARLLNFYKSLGYIETGKIINQVGDKELIRKYVENI